MTLFDWLLIGHFIGDWAFQNEWMVRHKQEALFNRAVFVHCTIYTSVLLLVVWLYNPATNSAPHILFFTATTYITHWLIDATNAAKYWMHVLQQSDALFVRIVVDQIFHIFILALLANFLFA
jgi:hypothetical protein